MSITVAQLHDPISNFLLPARLTVNPYDTVEVALLWARELPPTQTVLSCYVIDEDRRLVGSVSIRALLTTEPTVRMDTIMETNVPAVPTWATVLVAAEYFVNGSHLSVPVVDREGRLVGTVDVSLFTDDVLEMAKQAFDNIFQLIGVHATEGRTPWTSFRDRFPWLLCNVAGGLLCAVVASHYESLLNVVVVLAVFIPVVLALAESVSIQAVTLTLQNLTDGATPWRSVARGVGREFLTALMLGVCCESIIGLVADLWKRTIGVGIALALAITISMIVACLLGVLVPTGLRALKADPRIAAGPIVLALTDLVTLGVYFNLAGLLLT